MSTDFTGVAKHVKVCAGDLINYYNTLSKGYQWIMPENAELIIGILIRIEILVLPPGCWPCGPEAGVGYLLKPAEFFPLIPQNSRQK